MGRTIFIVAFTLIALAVIAVSLDRAKDIRRMTDWPFRDMAATNGIIFAALFLGSYLGLLFVTATGLRALGWI